MAVLQVWDHNSTFYSIWVLFYLKGILFQAAGEVSELARNGIILVDTECTHPPRFRDEEFEREFKTFWGRVRKE